MDGDSWSARLSSASRRYQSALQSRSGKLNFVCLVAEKKKRKKKVGLRGDSLYVVENFFLFFVISFSTGNQGNWFFFFFFFKFVKLYVA